MKNHAPIVAAFVLAASYACNTDKASEPRSQAVTTTEDFEDVVRLLDAGAAPRAQLRYRHAGERSERLIMNLGLTSLQEAPQEADLGEAVMKVAMDVGVNTPVSSGLSTYPLRLELLGVDTPSGWSNEQRAALEKQLAPLSQVTATFQIDTRGLTQRMELSLPPGGSPRLLTTIGNVRSSLVSLPLPLDPVGVGARWQVERPVLVGSIRAQQTTTYTLLESHASELRLRVSLLQTALPQQVAFGQDGTTLILEAYEVRAVGSSVVNLDRVTPLGELRGGSELRGTLRRDGQRDRVLVTGGSLLVSVEPAADSVTSRSSR